MDSELEQVLGDVGSLPTMVTPACDLDGGLCVTPAECPVIEPPGVSVIVTWPSMVYSPAGPMVVSLEFSHPSTGSVGVLSVPRTSPVVPAPEECLLLNAADTNQAQPEAGPSFTGDPAGGLFPAVPLTPRPATASHHDGESEAPDLSREGPFDIHQDNPRSVTSPRLLQDNQGCPFRMRRRPVDQIQLHDPRLLECVGAPESARLTTRRPEYWVHHMGREKVLSAALQLQHDAGLILLNVQVMQQLVTALNRTSSDVLRAVHGRRPFPANTMQQVMPSYRVHCATHYMMVMGLWHLPVATEIRGPLPMATCSACMSCSDCFPDVPM